MKKISLALFFLILILCNKSYGQWTTDQYGNMYNTNSGNVGIGLVPLHFFDVNGDINSHATVLWNNGRSWLSPDQGGSIKLGDGLGHTNGKTPTPDIPYIDFHWGLNNTGQIFNYRIINEDNNVLNFRNSSTQKVISFTNNELQVYNPGDANNRQLDFGVSLSPYPFAYISPWDPTSGTIYLVLGAPGVGINTGNTPPIQQLDVAGKLRVASGVIQNGTVPVTATSDLGLYSQNGNWMRFVTNQTPIRFFTTLGANYSGDDNDPKMTIEANGNVGIGTANPDASYKLSVNGYVRAKEVTVEAGWSDFVFNKDYKLRSLDEVEQYISKNGHLPEVPSQVQVAKDGVQLGDMTAKLLQKVEELTLYVIEQKKEIDALKKDIQLKEGH